MVKIFFWCMTSARNAMKLFWQERGETTVLVLQWTSSESNTKIKFLVRDDGWVRVRIVFKDWLTIRWFEDWVALYENGGDDRLYGLKSWWSLNGSLIRKKNDGRKWSLIRQKTKSEMQGYALGRFIDFNHNERCALRIVLEWTCWMRVPDWPRLWFQSLLFLANILAARPLRLNTRNIQVRKWLD